jgi:pyocin large subunit-like protein
VAIFATKFADAGSRKDHYKKHGHEFQFGAATESDYESLAARFLNMPLNWAILECVRRRNGDIIRYSRPFGYFAIMGLDGTIKTFFVPNVSRHGCASDRDYFYAVCSK